VAALLAVNLGYHAALTSLLGIEEDGDELARLLESRPEPAVVLALCAFPAIFEEIGCRGLCQARLVATLGRAGGFIGTSIIFAALHFSVLSAPYLFLVGMVLSWVRDGTGSLWPPMALHFIHNAAVVYFLRGGAP
jgi:membrane protease YdiL (CAAX protease family)